MKKIFKNITYFTLLYCVLFIVDTVIKINLDSFPYRYFSKTALLLSLVGFYIFNQREDHKNKHILMCMALLCFILGDILFIEFSVKWRFALGVALFAIGKIIYAIRFSNKKEFEIAKLIPFLIFSFVYMCSVMIMIYINLGDHLLPAFAYLLIIMIVAQFAYLRKNEVNTISFWFVLIGVLLFLFSDTIAIFKKYYNPNFLYNKYSTMFFYGASQYFIVVGILLEKNMKLLKNKLEGNNSSNVK